MAMHQLSKLNKYRIVIVGGGPAGSATAYFLAKAGFDVTVLERSTRPPYGQGIDITNQAVDVVKRMNLLDKIKQNTTGETGFTLLDDEGKQIGLSLGTNAAEVGVTKGDGPASLTNEIEIMRGTLTTVLADAAKEQQAKFRYGCSVIDIEQNSDSIKATLSDTHQPELFTAIIGADGVASQVRKMTFPKEIQENCYNQTDTFSAYFSMPIDKDEQVTHSKFQHGAKGRGIWIRPIDKEGTRASAYFISTSPEHNELQSVMSKSATPDQQKSVFEKIFGDMKGLKEGVIHGMWNCDDWHFTRLVQVRLPTWHVGRTALVGDAAYCSSPLTGQGTTMALMGSYILAGELQANPDDPSAAFTEYKKKFEPYVKEEGAIPFSGRAPTIFVPQSNLGVWIFRQIFRRWSEGYGQRLVKFPGSFGDEGARTGYKLPEYPL